jgi:DNA-binding MarR family transcriptional regulator/GNAT superfamily N-acetyltransferase
MPAADPHIAAIRAFNRSYTRRIGVLADGLLGSPFSLTEVRVLFELAQRDGATASELIAELGLDAGYMSRILRGFERRGLLLRKPAPDDARRSLLSLSAKGLRTFAPLDAKARAEIAGLLAPLSEGERQRLVYAMRSIEELTGASTTGERRVSRGSADRAEPNPRHDVVIRTHRPGDIGWLVHRHGAIYDREYGWGDRFEGLVAEIAGRFLRTHDPARERCWIAEYRGAKSSSTNVGSIMLVRKSAHVGQLRLLLVEPEARGLGIGRRLVAECIAFAREAGYRKIVLWTNRGLDAAKHLYEEAGFTLDREEPHDDFGVGLIAQVWSLKLV